MRGAKPFQQNIYRVFEKINIFHYISQGHSSRINSRCIVAALRDVPAERRHNTATVGPVTVALGNLLENIFCFFKYPVNKSRRPASKLYLFENVMNI